MEYADTLWCTSLPNLNAGLIRWSNALQCTHNAHSTPNGSIWNSIGWINSTYHGHDGHAFLCISSRNQRNRIQFHFSPKPNLSDALTQSQSRENQLQKRDIVSVLHQTTAVEWIVCHVSRITVHSRGIKYTLVVRSTIQGLCITFDTLNRSLTFRTVYTSYRYCRMYWHVIVLNNFTNLCELSHNYE